MPKLKEKVKAIFKRADKEVKVVQGKSPKNKLYSSCNRLKTSNSGDFFDDCKKRLFNVNQWTKIKGPHNATFSLHNSFGQPISSVRPSVGSFIKIELPGPFPENWVKVLEVIEDDHQASFTVRPCANPKKFENEKTEHFFTDEARSTFIVELAKNKICAYEIGVNEKINNQGAEGAGRKAVNTMIAEGGGLGFQRIQWKSITEFVVGL